MQSLSHQLNTTINVSNSLSLTLIWAVLYAIIFAAYGFVFFQAGRGRLDWRLALPFVLNLVLNIAFAPIQSEFKNLIVTTADIVLVLFTIIWAMASIWPKYKWVALAQVPYLLWVMVAALLQIQITLAAH